MKKFVFLSLVFSLVAGAYAVEPSGQNWLPADYTPVYDSVVVEEETKEEEPEVVELEVIPHVEEEVVASVPQAWTLPNGLVNEQAALTFFQEHGIVDKMALAVIMGNIKQESKFHPNICEGGARVPYHRCHRGGYGLVQWTTSFRYWGLGNHAKTIGGNPSSLHTQLSYLVTEREWKKAMKMFVIPDKSLSYYMKAAAHRS